VTPTDAAAQRLGVQETVYATAIVHETRACLRRGRRIIGGVVEPAVGEVVGSSAGSSSALSAGSSDYRVVGVAVERAVGGVVGSSAWPSSALSAWSSGRRWVVECAVGGVVGLSARPSSGVYATPTDAAAQRLVVHETRVRRRHRPRDPCTPPLGCWPPRGADAAP
jgi:hypothetical protein